MKTVLIFFVLLAAKTFGFPLESKNGLSEFTAIGRPAALKIVGHGVGPTGQLVLAPDGSDYLLSGTVDLDLESFDTGIEMRDKHMKEKYLETAKNRKATVKFVSAHLAKETLEKNGEVTLPALLLLHGVEKPVEVKTSFLKDSSGELKTTSSFQIKISDFGIQIPSFSGLTVADQIQIKIEMKVSKNDLLSDLTSKSETDSAKKVQ